MNYAKRAYEWLDALLLLSGEEFDAKFKEILTTVVEDDNAVVAIRTMRTILTNLENVGRVPEHLRKCEEFMEYFHKYSSISISKVKLVPHKVNPKGYIVDPEYVMYERNENA